MLQIAIWQKRSLSVSVDLDLFALQIGVEIARLSHHRNVPAVPALLRHLEPRVSVFQIVCCALDDTNKVVVRHPMQPV